MPFSRLGAQHRMRPEISVMMRPIYEKLSDHESVFNFEHIKGINKDIFFVNHKENEVNKMYKSKYIKVGVLPIVHIIVL